MNRILFLLLCVSFVVSCKTDNSSSKTPLPVTRVQVPSFSADGAYAYIEKQLSFGYRIPGTDEHIACKDWMVEELTKLGADVHVQKFDAKFHWGETFPSYNVVAQINPKHKSRIFIAAHWDSRREADHDPDESLKGKPIQGADDGASGVAVAMELVKTIQANPIDMGVDIVFFDAEDQGAGNGKMESWCLGSQHWARNLYPQKYKPRYGILLDMVGSKNPRFAKDAHSVGYAPRVVDKIWTLASDMGYSDMFVNEPGCQITDDHYFVNVIANIPTIDIINQVNQGVEDSNACFGSHWHTQNDDISIIDKRTLKVVGQVVTAALYKESGNQL